MKIYNYKALRKKSTKQSLPFSTYNRITKASILKVINLKKHRE